jgi:hypothetical protein
VEITPELVKKQKELQLRLDGILKEMEGSPLRLDVALPHGEMDSLKTVVDVLKSSVHGSSYLCFPSDHYEIRIFPVEGRARPVFMSLIGQELQLRKAQDAQARGEPTTLCETSILRESFEISQQGMNGDDVKILMRQAMDAGEERMWKKIAHMPFQEVIEFYRDKHKVSERT